MQPNSTKNGQDSTKNSQGAERARTDYVGTLVGESTSRQFRIALAREAIREQDIIAVDVELKAMNKGDENEKMRLWAKVQNIERLNPLFPAESGHELAETRTSAFDTVLSLSREMVTAVCQILGSEQIEGGKGKLDHVRYPPQPATQAYKPNQVELKRIVLGDLKEGRALDLAVLSNRPEVDVSVDGHAIVTRHLAILAMTGAGKSWTARRLVEELAAKNYPIVIFDPHGDYTGLGDVEVLKGKVDRYYAKFPLFDEDAETAARIVDALGYPLSDTMVGFFTDAFNAAKAFYSEDSKERTERIEWLKQVVAGRPEYQYNYGRDMWLVALLTEAGEEILRMDDSPDKITRKQQLVDWGWGPFNGYRNSDARTLDAIKKRVRKTAAALKRMEDINQKVAGTANTLPLKKSDLVKYGKISVVSLAGYTSDFQATIYSLIASEVFNDKVQDASKLPVLFLLEEAHNFVPAKANTVAEERSIAITKQIAQEGRKFGVGLTLVSQRPSRLDETTLAMCNSFIIMRMINPADQNFVRKVIESLGEDDAAMLPDLDVGEAIISGQLINFPVLVRIKEPLSKGEREEEDAFAALDKANTNNLQKPQSPPSRSK